ncbi:MAG TPA: signal peptidase I [Patescibacteria group bacterium]|nr:signal peptidase I [Patescibacteria group bacterium]
MKKILLFLTFPLSHIFITLRSKGSKKQKLVHVLLSLVLFPIWALTIYISGYFLLPELGLPLKPFQVVGDSMLPTFKDKEIVGTRLMKSILGNHEPQREDIVVFQNAKTLHDGKPAAFIKRVIAIGGDKARLADGKVYLNNSPLNEPYLLAKNSTWSENFCEDLNIPKGFVLIMGDNRSHSNDSREFGLVSNKDIISYLSLSDQSNYKKIWATQSKEGLFKIDEFINLINQKREESGSPKLVKNDLLVNAARRKSDVVFTYNDTSYSATRSGETMGRILQEVGFKQAGYFNELTLKNTNLDTSEFVDYFMKDEKLKKFILDKTYAQIGISDENGKLNNCSANIKEFITF